MIRLLLTLAGIYGFRLSRQASETIDRIAAEARSGDAAASTHFTQTSYARVLGVKNSDLGLLYYGAVAVAAAAGLVRFRTVHRSLSLGSWLSLAMSAYLLWALAFRLRVWCAICMRGHALNLITWWLLRRMNA
jgi:uncharacterized membrane protein